MGFKLYMHVFVMIVLWYFFSTVHVKSHPVCHQNAFFFFFFFFFFLLGSNEPMLISYKNRVPLKPVLVGVNSNANCSAFI